MKEKICDILSEIDLEIDEIDLYGYDIIETSLSMVHRLQTVLSDLRTKIQTYVFPTKRMKYYFSRYKTGNTWAAAIFYKIYRIETQCPNGSDEVIKGILVGNWIT